MKYTIITVNYNHCSGLLRTIESVARQTWRDYEYIVVDGASTDGSVDILRSHSQCISHWVSEPDGGTYNAMNKAIAMAHGDYLNFMNSGDCFADAHVLENMAPLLTADIVCGKNVSPSRGVFGIDDDDITLMHLFRGTLPHQASFIRRQLFDGHPYDEQYKIIADWVFWVDALVYRNASFRNTPLHVCLFEDGGISADDPKRAAEGKTAFQKLFPPRILNDYLRYRDVESPLLQMIPQFNHTYRFHRLVCSIVGFLLWWRRLLCKRK